MIVCLAVHVIIAILVKKYQQLTLRLTAIGVPSSAIGSQDYESIDLSFASHTTAVYEIPRVEPAAVNETPMLSAEEPITVLTNNMAYATWLPLTEALPLPGRNVDSTLIK